MSFKKYLDKLASLEGKTILLAGGTSGIGLAASNHILYKNGKLVLLARNLKKAENAKKDLLNKYPDAYIDIIEYDQANKKIIDKAVNEIVKKYPNFNSLILNAGIFCPSTKDVDEEGYTLTYSTNIIGLNYFITKLTPYLNKNHRLIIQGSFVARYNVKEDVSLKDPNQNMFKQYVYSKGMCEALFYHLKKEGTSYELILSEPGLCSTEITRGTPALFRFLGKIFLTLFAQPKEKGALPLILALMEDTPNHSYIRPSSLDSHFGYPAISKFPKKREREYLIKLIK